MINRLKDEVEKRFGGKIVSAKSCQTLSMSIQDRVSERLSEATIRRFWGFIPGKSTPSKATLDIFSRYVGYSSWEDFQASFGMAMLPNNVASIWINAKINGDEVSKNTISYIFKKSGLLAADILERSCINEHLEHFLSSDYVASALIAPAGYGKSLGIASWLNRNIDSVKYCNHLFYFINGKHVDATYQQGMSIESWMQTLVFKTNLNFINRDIESVGAKLVIVIDAFDQLETNLFKAKSFFSKLVDFIALDWVKRNFQFVITVRTTVWERELVHDIVSNEAAQNAWMGVNNIYLHDDSTNIPLLGRTEIQDIVNKTINKKFRGQKLLMEQINFSLQETLAHPYMLKLFIAIYSNNLLWFQSSTDVIDEFINREIANSKYSDEKLDLINFILEAQEYGRKLEPVKKNSLKEAYPIHLRKSGNYFSAYEHLLAYGILTEETVVNRYKNMVTQVDFSQTLLRDLLITRHLIEKNDGITLSLFVDVDKAYAGKEVRTSILCNLYSIAYTENNFDALKDFFTLPSSITTDKNILRFILSTFKSDKPIRQLLILEYCKSEIFVESIMESSFDFDSTCLLYGKIFGEIEKKNLNNNQKIVCYAALAISKIMEVNIDEFLYYSHKLEELKPDGNSNSNALFLWLLWKMFFSKIANPANNDVANEQIGDAYKYAFGIFQSNSRYNVQNQISFLLEFLSFSFAFKPLSITNIIINDINRLEESINGEIDGNQKKLLMLYVALNKTVEDRRFFISKSDMLSFEIEMNNIASKHKYINRIIAYILLARYHMSHDNQTKFTSYFQYALDICTNANYKMIEIILLKVLSGILSRLDLEQQSQDCLSYSKLIADDRGQILYEML